MSVTGIWQFGYVVSSIRLDQFKCGKTWDVKIANRQPRIVPNAGATIHLLRGDGRQAGPFMAAHHIATWGGCMQVAEPDFESHFEKHQVTQEELLQMKEKRTSEQAIVPAKRQFVDKIWTLRFADVRKLEAPVLIPVKPRGSELEARMVDTRYIDSPTHTPTFPLTSSRLTHPHTNLPTHQVDPTIPTSHPTQSTQPHPGTRHRGCASTPSMLCQFRRQGCGQFLNRGKSPDNGKHQPCSKCHQHLRRHCSEQHQDQNQGLRGLCQV